MTAPPTNYYEEGLAQLDAENYEAAIDLLTKALRLSLGDLASILLYRGIAYASLNDAMRAMADFNACIQQNPYLADAYNERGNLLVTQSDYEAALVDYGMALQVDPEHYEAVYNRALAYETLKQYANAEKDLNRVLELRSSLLPAYEVRGRIRAELNDIDGAIKDLKHYLRHGGGRYYDNVSETQSFIINLRITQLFSRILPFGRQRKSS